MSKKITKEAIRVLLNDRRTPILQITNLIKQYMLQPEIRGPLLNHLRKQYLNNKEYNVLKWFIEYNEELVCKTALCSTKYSAQILLKTVWQMLPELHIELAKNIRENIILDEPNKKVLSREERLIKQAEIMRAAKARKREERLKAENKEIKKEPLEKVEQPKKELTEEEIERIKWLRKL